MASRLYVWNEQTKANLLQIPAVDSKKGDLQCARQSSAISAYSVGLLISHSC